MEGDKCVTSWDSYEGGPAGCAESLWRRETCEWQRGGPVSGLGPFHEGKNRGMGKGQDEMGTPEKLGIEKGYMTMEGDARVLVEVRNKRS